MWTHQYHLRVRLDRDVTNSILPTHCNVPVNLLVIPIIEHVMYPTTGNSIFILCVYMYIICLFICVYIYIYMCVCVYWLQAVVVNPSLTSALETILTVEA